MVICTSLGSGIYEFTRTKRLPDWYISSTMFTSFQQMKDEFQELYPDMEEIHWATIWSRLIQPRLIDRRWYHMISHDTIWLTGDIEDILLLIAEQTPERDMSYTDWRDKILSHFPMLKS